MNVRKNELKTKREILNISPSLKPDKAISHSNIYKKELYGII